MSHLWRPTSFPSAILTIALTLGSALTAPGQTPLSESRALHLRQPDGSTSDTRPQLFPMMSLDKQGHWRLFLNGDTRIRAEARINSDQDRQRADDDRLILTRTRLSADLTYRRLFRGFLESLDAREIGANTPRNQENDFDTLHQAFVEVAPDEPSPWSLRAGLQEMRLGRDRRLFNATGWNNLRRTFLAARLMRRTPQWDLDLFAGQPRSNTMPHGDGTATGNERLLPGQYVYGAYATLRPRRDHEVEIYALGQSDRMDNRTFPNNNKSEDGQNGTLERHTIGISAYGPIARTAAGRLTYGAGGAWQFGNRSTDEIRAGMAHGEIAHEFREWRYKPRLALEGFWASGDHRPNDGVQGTFNNLYGSNASLYSRSGLVRGSNLRMLGPTLRLDPTDRVRISAGVYQFWVDSDTDGWVRGSGERNGQDRRGVGSTGLGQEASVLGSYRLSKWATVEAGGSVAIPGQFGANFGRGDTSVYGFTQVTIQF